jgi:hypothetical protein
MQPISRKWLNQTVTMFNLFKDPETGQISHFRSVLENVRVGTVKTSFAESLKGSAKRFELRVLIDHKTTVGYRLDDSNGQKFKKKFMSLPEWEELTEEDKTGYWTLNEKDWLFYLPGTKKSICPDFNGSNLSEQQFRDKYHIYVISEIPATIDKDGSLHHWEVVLD